MCCPTFQALQTRGKPIQRLHEILKKMAGKGCGQNSGALRIPFLLSVLMVCLPYTFPLATPLDIISIYNQYINTHI